MKVGASVRLAIVEWERAEVELAMLHARNAVDGTAGKSRIAGLRACFSFA